MARLYMQGLHRVLNMCEYGSICSILAEYALIFLTMPEHGLILVNIPKYV